MIELTEKESHAIIDTVQKVREKHFDGSEITGEKLGRLANELEGRLNDLGYKVTVDVSPMFQGIPPTVRIDGRIDGQNELGVEQKMYEVRKRVERNEDVADIEGHV
jgi:hypothetical protein